MHLHVTENNLKNFSNHSVRQYRYEICNVIKNDLLPKFYEIGTKMTQEEAGEILRSGRLESERILHFNDVVYFIWHISIGNIFEYPISTCDKTYHK